MLHGTLTVFNVFVTCMQTITTAASDKWRADSRTRKSVKWRSKKFNYRRNDRQVCVWCYTKQPSKVVKHFPDDHCSAGPGYPSPLWAMKNGPREKILYVVTVQPNQNDESGDYLSTVDVDPESATYCQVIHRSYAGRKGQEFHHIGWNTCSSCHSSKSSCGGAKRDKLVLPCLSSDAV